jgi:hypothetical protein
VVSEGVGIRKLVQGMFAKKSAILMEISDNRPDKEKTNPAINEEKGISSTPIKPNTTIKKPARGTMSKFATSPEKEKRLK